MAAINDIVTPSLTFEEILSDGSTLTNPAADGRRLFLGEDGLFHMKDSAGAVTDVGGAGGSVATDAIWDAAGDLVQGTGANTAARLPAGLAGQLLRSAGAAAANVWAYPPGYEFDYVEITSNVNVTATTEGGADTVVTGSAVTYDGSTIVMVEFFSPLVLNGTTWTRIQLYDGAASIGQTWGYWQHSTASYGSLKLERRLTPSAASHTYSVRAYVDAGTGTVFGGAGGSGNVMPAFIRITKV